MNDLLAQIQLGPSTGAGFRCLGLSKLCSFGEAEGPALLNSVLSTIVGVMTGIAAIWFLFQLFIGAISIIGAEGDKAKLAEAKAKITMAIVGIIVTVSAIFLIDLVGFILGFDILNPAEFIITLSQQ